MVRILSFVISLVLLFFVSPVLAEEEVLTEKENPVRFEKGYYEFGLEVGYGAGFDIPFGRDRTDIQFSHVAANFQLDLTGTIGGEGPYRGNLNWYAELNANLLDNPGFGTLVGFSPLMFKYKFLDSERKWAPTLLAGAGFAFTDWDEENLANREISGDFQFLLHTGVGIEYFRPGSRSFSINYRYFHVSNAGIESPNIGLNAGLFTLSFHF